MDKLFARERVEQIKWLLKEGAGLDLDAPGEVQIPADLLAPLDFRELEGWKVSYDVENVLVSHQPPCSLVLPKKPCSRTSRSDRISIRIPRDVLRRVRKDAELRKLPYQTLINLVLEEFVAGRFIDEHHRRMMVAKEKARRTQS